MDPLSIVASSFTLVGALAKLGEAANSAFHCASALKKVDKQYTQTAQDLQSLVNTIKQLDSLKEEISEIDDARIQSFNIDQKALDEHLDSAKELEKTLQKHQKHMRGWRRRWSAVRITFGSEHIKSDLDSSIDRVRNLFGCVSSLHATVQTALALSTREICVSTTQQAIAHHGVTGEKLNRVSLVVEHAAHEVSATRDKIMEIHGMQRQLIFGTSCRPIAETNTKPRSFIVPYPRNPCFVGREDLLCKISACLTPPDEGSSGRAFCVHGLPGIGKTHTAIEFAYRQKDDSKFTHIFWISADSVEKLEQGLVGIARDLGLANSTVFEDRDKLVGLARSWLEKPHDASWLLILDNVDSSQVLNPYWSAFNEGSVLITSRDMIQGLAAVITSPTDSDSVEAFSLPEGAEFIRKRLSTRRIQGLNENTAGDLASKLGLYPLVLDQMVTVIESEPEPMPLSQMHELLKIEFGDELFQNIKPDSPWYQDSAGAAIETHIMNMDKQYRLGLGTIAFFDPDNIPVQLLLSKDRKVACFENEAKLRVILSRLRKSSFIGTANKGIGDDCKRINIHRLVRDCALRMCPDHQMAFENAVHLLRQAFPLHHFSRDHMVEYWEVCEKFQPHVLTLHQQYIHLKTVDAIPLRSFFEFIDLIYSCACCLEGYEEIISREHTQVGVPSTIPAAFLSDLYTVQQFYHTEATSDISMIDLARKALNIREDAVKEGLLDPHHPNRANGFMNVGVAMAWEDPKGAIEMHDRALEIRLHAHSDYKDDQIHGLALNYLNVGRCWLLVDDLKTAASCFEKSLDIIKAREQKLRKQFTL
ncbi:hypothetical protein QC764_0097480 [Podospora pseudoanserina]|uniref:AAA+ ATPase domain-containing protein n=1 Tax=Podospora pseudoanserina TaxID=2609844 RepID=A0ABR0HU58_9PEZI|nr:hypothetical protein QC764_0097480 [Podospora pseudoanserina]